MEYRKLGTTRRLAVDVSLDMRIRHFWTATEKVKEAKALYHGDFHTCVFASLFPNGVDENTEGWLELFIDVKVFNQLGIINNDVYSWTVSIVDVEGNYRFPRSFERYPSHKRVRDARYLERSFILNRADELISRGELKLHCDVYFRWTDENNFWELPGDMEQRETVEEFLYSIPQAVYFATETEDPSDSFTVFDFTSKILTLPKFHELRKSFGLYGTSPALSWLISESRHNPGDDAEHIWIFDTQPDRFLLSLDERHDQLGARLMRISPIIELCVKAPWKEKQEKRIELSNVDSLTFKILLFFLEHGTFPRCITLELMNVYKMSHLYEMVELQQKCAERMVKSLEFDFDELNTIAHLYVDKYLSTLLNSRLGEFENHQIILQELKVVERLDFNCFM